MSFPSPTHICSNQIFLQKWALTINSNRKYSIGQNDVLLKNLGGLKKNIKWKGEKLSRLNNEVQLREEFKKARQEITHNTCKDH